MSSTMYADCIPKRLLEAGLHDVKECVYCEVETDLCV
jgi:hypothetical protein